MSIILSQWIKSRVEFVKNDLQIESEHRSTTGKQRNTLWQGSKKKTCAKVFISTFFFPQPVSKRIVFILGFRFFTRKSDETTTVTGPADGSFSRQLPTLKDAWLNSVSDSVRQEKMNMGHFEDRSPNVKRRDSKLGKM